MTLFIMIKFWLYRGEDVTVELVGIKVTEPSFGVEAFWIEPALATDAQSKGYVTVDPTSVLITHFGQILNNFAAELIGQDEVKIYWII